MPAANSIFISYRRSDSDYVTGHVYEKLRSHFGQSVIFKDTHAIPLGQDFRECIRQALDDSRVLLVVIGARWLDALRQRTDEGQHDWVREELETALDREDRMPIIPVLIEGVTMPKEEALPENLKELIYRNAAQVRPALDFDQDIALLIQGLEGILSVSGSAKLSRGQQLELDRFRAEMVDREQDYETVRKQLKVEMDGPDQNKLKARLNMLVEEINDLEQKIATLEKGS